jgi:hypothetical protein
MRAEIYVPPKRRAFSELHGVRTQNTALSAKNKLFLGLIKYKAMRPYGIIQVGFHVFLISALDGDEWFASRTGCFTSGVKASDTH